MEKTIFKMTNNEKIRLANGIKKETIMYNLQDILNGSDYYKEDQDNNNKVFVIFSTYKCEFATLKLFLSLPN